MLAQHLLLIALPWSSHGFSSAVHTFRQPRAADELLAQTFRHATLVHNDTLTRKTKDLKKKQKQKHEKTPPQQKHQ